VGSPISFPTAEIFFQGIENRLIKLIRERERIIYYPRYVGDILMVKSKAVPLHSMKAPGGRGGIAPTNS
jgi:hypothetical protein